MGDGEKLLTHLNSALKVLLGLDIFPRVSKKRLNFVDQCYLKTKLLKGKQSQYNTTGQNWSQITDYDCCLLLAYCLALRPSNSLGILNCGRPFFPVDCVLWSSLNLHLRLIQGRIKLFGAPRQWKHFRPLFQAVFLSEGGYYPPDSQTPRLPVPRQK